MACILLWSSAVNHGSSAVNHLVTMNSKSAHLLWLPRDQWDKRYKIHKEWIKFWTFTVILTLKTTIQFLHTKIQLMMMYHPIKFGCKKVSSSADMVESHIWLNEPSLWPLNLKTANQSSCMTPWPMMLHHRTRFGYKRFSSWGDIIQMNIHWNS